MGNVTEFVVCYERFFTIQTTRALAISRLVMRLPKASPLSSATLSSVKLHFVFCEQTFPQDNNLIVLCVCVFFFSAQRFHSVIANHNDMFI